MRSRLKSSRAEQVGARAPERGNGTNGPTSTSPSTFVGMLAWKRPKARLTSEAARWSRTLQMLADGALRHVDAMPCFQDRADLDCGAGWQFRRGAGRLPPGVPDGDARRPDRHVVEAADRPARSRWRGSAISVTRSRSATAIRCSKGWFASSRTRWPRSAESELRLLRRQCAAGAGQCLAWISALSTSGCR
jgi:hypothetical protein